MGTIPKLGKTVLSVFFELNLASAFCDYLYVLKNGLIAAEGTPEVICTAELLKEVFGVRAEVLTREGGRPYIVYKGSV